MIDPKKPGAEASDVENYDVDEGPEVLEDEAVLTDSDEGDDDADDGQSDLDAGDDGSEDASGDHEGQARQSHEVKQPGRRERAVIEAKRVAKEAKAEVEAVRRELAEERAQRNGRQTAEQQAMERERIALMSPEERTSYEVDKVRQELGRELGNIRFQTADASDKSGFDSLCARNPAYASVQDRVEELLANERRAGSNPKREVVAKYLIGELAIQRAGRAKGKQAKAGAAKVSRETVRSGGDSRSNIGRDSNTNTAAARRKRLEGQNI